MIYTNQKKIDLEIRILHVGNGDFFFQESGVAIPSKFKRVFFANEAADPRGSAVELANHRAVREYRRKISSQRKGLFLTIFGCK